MACYVGQDCSLVSDVVDLFELDDFCFAQDLQGVYLCVAGVLFERCVGGVGGSDQTDARECTFMVSSQFGCDGMY